MAGVRGKIDLSGLQKFQEALKKLDGAQRQKWWEAAVKEMAARLLAKAIKRTPKDRGTLQHGWTVGEVKKDGDEYTVEVINPVYYAPYVEFGHRTANHRGWVEGRFMLTISEQELLADAPRILQAKLDRFMGGIK